MPTSLQQAMSTSGVMLPGLFSQLGRSTAFEIESLQNQLNLNDKLDGSADVDDNEKKPKPASHSSKPKVASKGSGAAPGQDDLKPRTPGGELAKIIQEKLHKNDEDNKAVDPNTSKSLTAEKSDHLTVAFSREGKDGNYADKFTASYDIGALNHRGEQRPELPYQIKHDAVLVRRAECDFRHRPKTKPLSKPEPDPADGPMAFMTGLDLDDKEAMQALTARQRGLLKDVMGLGAEKPKPLGTTMSLNSERGPLGKIGRNHVIGNEVSNAYDSDLLDQDIKAYQKLRYPVWDMNAPAPRGPLLKADSLGEPGKYEVNLDSVKAVPRSVGFGKGLPRSVCVSTMGYSAPPAILHPEEKRTRGVLPDRSCAKDIGRTKIPLVNDFDRELPRPPLLTGAAQNFHDENDPAACDAVYQRQMSYDATSADVYVTHRRDTAPKYARMLGRGRDSVQGLRALSSDLAVRGAVGLGFVETKSMAESSVLQKEARAADGSKENPNIGPRFDYRTVNVHNSVTERMQRGSPLVKGSDLDRKYSQLNKKDNPILTNAFKRSPSLPGFDARCKFGGTRVLAQSRSSVAMPGWAPVELDSAASW